MDDLSGLRGARRLRDSLVYYGHLRNEASHGTSSQLRSIILASVIAESS